MWSFKQVGAQAGLELIETALASVVVISTDDYLEEDPAVVAVAAAELLTAVMGLPVEKSPYNEAALDWVAWAKPEVTSQLVELAHRAVLRVLGPESELAELWDENGDSWRRSVLQLSSKFE
jgi:hypothetical protein